MKNGIIYFFMVLLILLPLCGCSNPKDRTYINQMRDAIKEIPLPTIYSEYNGDLLKTKEPNIKIMYYGRLTSKPYFTVSVDYYNPNTHFWDNIDWIWVTPKDNGHTARLIKKQNDDNFPGYFKSESYITLSDLQTDKIDFEWYY